MRDVKLLNGLLWGLNGLLGLGILAFSFRYLIYQDTNYLRGFVPEPPITGPQPAPSKPPETSLKNLRNPLQRGSDSLGPAVQLFRAQLKGTLSGQKDPKRGVAFIKSITRNTELIAYVDEDIVDNGKPSEEYHGWKLKEVGKDYAVFSDGERKQTLTLDLSAPVSGSPALGAALGAATGRSNQPYSSTQFKSRLLASSDSRHVWGIDPDEIDWAIQNQDALLDQAFQVSPAGGGGVKIDNIMAGSIGAARGLMPGDIVRDVNGQPLNTIADMKNLINNPSMRQQTGMRLTIERSGRPVIIEYKPLPQK